MVNLEATLGLTFWVVSIVNEIANVQILNSWTVNNELCFDGVIRTKCAEKITDGWEMHLKSSQSLSTLTSSHADIWKNNANSTTFILTSLSWNSQCLAGEIIQVSFAGCTPQKDTTLEMTAQFNRNGTLCPQVIPPANRQSIKLSTILTHDDHSTFRASLSITLPVTIQGNWLIYFAVSTQLSRLDAAGVLSTPSQGDVFTLTNLSWQSMFMAGLTYVLEVEGTKAIQETKESCVIAMFAWDKDMEIHPSTTIKPTLSSTEIVHQTVPIITRSIAPTSTATTLPQSCAPFDYDEVLHKSILFYEAQRSGQLPANNRIAWRADSALGDKGDGGEDLTGGWYDAGDYVKFGFPMAFSTTLLTWGLIEFPQSYTASGEMENMFNSIKWPLDYFVKAHVNPNEFYGQVGDGDTDHAYWGRPEDMTIPRPAFKIDSARPGSDLAAETAAAMAAGSIAFAERNPDYAQSLLDHAKTLYSFADNYRGKYSDSITDAAQFYSSSGYGDELAWGATWLYRATNNDTYLTKAENYFSNFNIGNPAWGFSWDEKIAGVQMLLFQLTGKDVYKTAIQSSLDQWLPGGSVAYTPKGLAWRIQWGSNRYAANTAFLALLAATKGLKTTEYREFGEKQLHYMLGDSGRSFVVGFGHNPPTRPHHASSSCPDKPDSCGWDDFSRDAANPQVLQGALVGGPDQNDGYQDKRDDFVRNEVACDYNAGFQSAVAALKAADVASCSLTVQMQTTTAISTLVQLTTTPTFQSTSIINILPRTSDNWISTTLSTASATITLPQSCAPFDYDEVLHKSILFYEAQRSGQLPANNRIAWRGDSGLGDKGDGGEDLTGGWYDAGDYVKFGFPMAFSTTLLTWGLIEFPQSYTASGEMENMFNSIKWPLDYFVKAHVNPNEFYGQVGDGDIDHAYWGRPEEMTIPRPAFKIDSARPGSDLAAETAAAMAAGSIAFAERNPDYAQSLLDHAKTLYSFADNYRGKYSDSITDAAQFYSSSGYGDELAWGAAWLYRATNDDSYLTKAENYFSNFNIGNPAWGFSWDEKVAGVQMLLFQLTGKDAYKTAIQSSLDQWLPGGSVAYTPKGLAWRIQWGSNRYAANTAFLALLAATKGLKTTEYREFGEKQLHYMLGESGRSFVVGFGHNPPTRPHHASSSCPDKPASCGWDDFSRDAANPQVLHGALVGGPDQNDGYEDKRDDFVRNEVACDYNAGFQSAVAALKAAAVASCSGVGATASIWSLYSSQTVGSTSTSPARSSITKQFEGITSLETTYSKAHPTSVNNLQSSPYIQIQSSRSLSEIGSMLTSPARSSITERLESITSFEATYSKAHQTSVINVQSSPNIQIQSSRSLSEIGSMSTSLARSSITERLESITSFEATYSKAHQTSVINAQSSLNIKIQSSRSLSEIGSLSTSSSRSSITERLESITSLETSYFKADKTSPITIQTSPTIFVQPSSSTTTTGVGETVLPHECGDVTVPSGYYHLETSVNVVTDWPQGFTGQIIFTTTAEVRDGWQVELVMDNAISLLNVHIVTTTPSSGSRFTLRNKDYNIQLEQGSTITIDFEATKATVNDNVPCMRAVFMWAVEEACPTLDSASGGNSVGATVKIVSQWNEGISGEITVVVPAQIENGWQMQVLFDIPLTLTVYVATRSPATGTQFTLTNQSYNRQLQSGSTLVVAFTATKQEIGATVLCTDALFLW